MTDRHPTGAGPSARRVALDLLTRIDEEGAYANAVVGPALDRSALSAVDRRFVTDLVYGTTRMRRACDALVDRFVVQDPDSRTRTVLRLGAYQLAFAGVAPHAAVAETVGLAPRRSRGFVNAVLRRVAAADLAGVTWASDGARLSYPDWIVDRLRLELGEDADAAMEAMNRPPSAADRGDGYVQDVASQWVAAAVAARAGERVLDLCAAPGGKATAIAASGARVVAADVRVGRVSTILSSVARVGTGLGAIDVVAADGRVPPFRAASFHAVLVDAPCSGLGALRRRPDARWRIRAADVEVLAATQRALIESAGHLVAPGGRLVYSVCTLVAAESIDHATPDGFVVDDERPDGEWRAYGHGWRVLPQDADTDGMTMIRYRRDR
jgi:16S rRNA (cytosine967-C5)-methyltransferase